MLLNKKSLHGGDIYSNHPKVDFSANINPFGMPEAVQQALKNAIHKCQVYPDPYCTALREKIAIKEQVSVTNILCGNGAAELIYSFAFSLPKDKPALIVAPTFCEYEQALMVAGISVEYYKLKEKDNFRLTEEILHTDFKKYSAVFLCSPNNPTGITVGNHMLKMIAQSGVWLFCDFCFLDLTDMPDQYDIPVLLNDYPNVILLRAFTKSYAMAGVRLGYAMCKNTELLEEMSEKVQCWNISTFAQEAGIVALDCDEWLKESVKKISAERNRMIKELKALSICVYPGEANYLLLRSEISLYTHLMERGIMVRECSNYVGLTQEFVRIAIRTREENDFLLTELKAMV